MLIAVVNASTVVAQSQIQPYVDAQLHQFHYHLCPAWGLVPPAMAVYTKLSQIPQGAQAHVIYDNSDQQGALAYHSEYRGLIFSRTFAKTLLDNGLSWTSGASHEACEMRVDPSCNRSATDRNGAAFALEVADPVESTTYAIDRVDMSDFVHPAWFDPDAIARTRHCTVHGEPNLAPFHLARGGYAIVNDAPIYGERYPDWRKATKGAGSRTDRRGTA